MKFRFIFITIIGLCFSLASVAAPEHIIVMDGGSTSTRAFLFSYEETPLAQDDYPALTLHTKVSYKLPVTDPVFSNDPVAYFDTVFASLNDQYALTSEQRAQTPVYFMATAGVRGLPEEEQDTLINSIQDSLDISAQAQGYYIEQPLTQSVRVISGSEEGLYAWLSTQYWNDLLKQPTLTGNNTEPVMEMGGSSTQIGFLPNKAPTEHGFPYQHNDIEYLPYIYSYANFGNEARLATLYALYQNNKIPDFPACFPVDAPYPLTDPQLIGEGDFQRCQAAVQKATYVANPCENCSKMGVYQPRIVTDRATLTSGYFYTFNILGLSRQRINLAKLEKPATNFCATDWETLKKKHPTETESILLEYCFYAAWHDTVLRGYGFDGGSMVLATETINGVKDGADWATGATWVILTGR